MAVFDPEYKHTGLDRIGNIEQYLVNANGGSQPVTAKQAVRTGADLIYTTFAPSHGFTITQGGTAGDNLNDTSTPMLSSQTVKLVTDGAGTGKRLDHSGGLSIDIANRYPVLWLMVEDTTHLQSIEVWFGSGGFGTAFRLSPYNSVDTDRRIETVQSGDWVRLAFPWGAQTLISTFGSPSRSSLNSIRIQVFDDATGNPVTVHLGGIGGTPEPRHVWPHGVLSFTFDDCYETQFTVAKPALDKYGFPGTAYVICELADVGSPNLTLAQLRVLQDLSGWQIASHAYSLANHNTAGGWPVLGPTVAEKDFQNSHSWMAANGFEQAEDMAYPQGYFDDATLAVARRYYRSARTTISRTQETWPPGEPLKLRVRNLNGGTSLATVQGWIDDAYANAYWLILVTHDLNVANSGNQYDPTTFGQIVDYAATKGIDVRTVKDVLDSRSQKHGGSHRPGGVDDLYLNGGQAITAGAETFSRLHATTGIGFASGKLQLSQFTVPEDTTVSSLGFSTGGTAASGLTLARIGLYTVNTDASVTLVAATLSDATLGGVASTLYTKALDAGGSLPTSYTLKRGQRYAIGLLFVGTTPPNAAGNIPATTGLAGLSPVIAQFITGQTDLPTSVAAGSLTTWNNAPWAYAV